LRRIEIRVKPGARRDASLTEQPDGSWLAVLSAPPVDGAANAALLRLVAERFGRQRSKVRIKSGAASRRKLVEIDD
jgi:uncharacterized protein